MEDNCLRADLSTPFIHDAACLDVWEGHPLISLRLIFYLKGTRLDTYSYTFWLSASIFS